MSLSSPQCPYCYQPSSALVFSGMHYAAIKNVSLQCQNCGRMFKIPDGTYSTASHIMQRISSVALGLEQMQQLIALFSDEGSVNEPPLAIERAHAISPELGAVVNDAVQLGSWIILFELVKEVLPQLLELFDVSVPNNAKLVCGLLAVIVVSGLKLAESRTPKGTATQFQERVVALDAVREVVKEELAKHRQ